MSKLRIMLADDHETVREGLKMIVNAQDDMEVVGFAGDRTFLMPTSDLEGLLPNARVVPIRQRGEVAVGEGLLQQRLLLLDVALHRADRRRRGRGVGDGDVRAPWAGRDALQRGPHAPRHAREPARRVRDGPFHARPSCRRRR